MSSGEGGGGETRKLGPVLAAGLVAGNMIGSGVFLLPATLAQVGSISLVSWLIATVGGFATAAVFARLGAISRSPEGMVGYVDEGLGRFAGYAIAVMYWVASWVGTVAIAVAVAGYFAFFAPGLNTPVALAWTAIGAIWLFTALNLIGPKAAARFSSLSLVAGLLPILLVAIAGWAWFDPAVFHASWNVSGHSDVSAVKTAMISIYWAFTGLESAAVAAAVVREPQRNVPIATYGGTALAAAVFIAASTVITGLAPAAALAASSAPYALAAGRMLGPGVAGFVAACALVKTAGTLCGWVLVVAQSGRAGANTHFFPGRFGGDRPPWRLLVGMAVVMSAAALLSISPTLGKQFEVLINVSTVWTIIPYVVCCLALWRIAKGRMTERVVAMLALVFNVWLLTTSDMPTVWLTAGLFAAIGLGWLWARTRHARTT